MKFRRLERLGTWVIWIGFLALSCSSIAALVLALRAVPPLPDPLSYPLQIVAATPISGHPGTVVRSTDNVNVYAEKCNQSAAPVTVVGTTSWQAVQPSGYVVADSKPGSPTAVFAIGCVNRVYQHKIPAEVLRIDQLLKSQGNEIVLWRITGADTPVAPVGKTASWATDDFQILEPGQ